MGDSDREILTARTLEGIHDVAAASWDACAGNANPFLCHAFLAALEDSGSATRETGWAPRHLALERGGELVGAVPLYLKSHSQGEYVFDHGWADAFERAGGAYYPKLLAAVPFSPVPGPRLLVRPGPESDGLRQALIQTLVELARQTAVSSLHVTFPTEPEWQAMGSAGFLRRTGYQFHWSNRGFATFEDFLATLKSAKRKAIRRERREVAESGVEIRVLTGGAVGRAEWDAFFTFYIDTGGRKWGRPYLNRDFFRRLGERLGDRVALVLCSRAGRPVAGALNLIGADTLYGRYWGCLEDHRFLHFEACYYQAIELAIARGLARVEAGAQGPHKLQRGYVPCPTYSAHWIAHQGLRDAVAEFLRRERRQVEWEIRAILAQHSPYRQPCDGGQE